MAYPITKIIASRTLNWKKGKFKNVVEVQIGEPFPRINIDTGFKDWYCSFAIRGIGDDAVRTAFGEDSVQALLGALQLAGVVVANCPPAKAGLLDGAQLPNFGFPPI